MRTTRFYLDRPLSCGKSIELDKDSTHHLVTVLRAKQGSPVTLFNGDGKEFRGTLVATGKRSALVELHEETRPDNQSPIEIELAIGLSRGDRFDWVVQKATELGVSRITPLQTRYSEVHLNQQRQVKKAGHWQKISISACEQSGRCTLPLLSPVQDLAAWVSQCSSDLKLILDPDQGNSMQTVESDSPTTISLLIGPEGGFSEAEIESAISAGFQPVTLGPRVLRTETAPVAAITIVQWLWGDLR